MIENDAHDKLFYFATITVGDETVTVRVQDRIATQWERLEFEHPKTGRVIVVELAGTSTVWDSAPADLFHRNFVPAKILPSR